MTRRLIFLVLAAALFSSTAAVAQTARGVIEGNVTDDQGGVMPGTTVTLSGEDVMGQPTEVTLADGSFRFRGLEPGSYDLAFELAGFARLNREGIVIEGGRTITLNIALQVAAVAETITVSGESPMVDVRQTQIQATFDEVALHDVPSQSDVWGVLAQSPGIRMKGFDVGGSHKSQQTGYESFGIEGQVQSTVEGVNTTEGHSWTASYWDYYAIEEYKISASGADVEMANPGTFIESTVKSGGNSPSSLIHIDYESEGMVGDNVTDEKAARGFTGNPNLLFWELHADYGGPIQKDKFWIYGSYNHFKISKAISGIDPTDPEIIRQVEELGRDNALDDGIFDTFNLKGTYQLNDRDKLVGYLNWGNKQKPNRGLAANIPLESVLGQDFTWSSSKKIEWLRVWNSQLFTSSRLSFFSFTFPRSSRVDPQQRPPRVEETTSGRSGSGWLPFTTNRHKPAVDITTNYYVPDVAGSHDFKFGYHYLRDSARRGDNAGSGPIRYSDFEGVPFEVLLVDVPSLDILPAQTVTSALPNNIDAHNDFFVQDTWSPHQRLTLNIGVRYMHQRLFYNDIEKQPILDDPQWFPFLSDIFEDISVSGDEVYRSGNWAPRLGMTFDLTGEGRTVLKASFGRYWVNIADRLAGVNPGTTLSATYGFNDLNGDGVLSNRAELGDEVTRSGGSGTRINRDAPLPFSDEFQVSFEHQFAGETSIRAAYVYKTLEDAGLHHNNRINLAQFPFLTVPFQTVDPGDPNRTLNLVTTPADRFGSDEIHDVYPDGKDSNYDTILFTFNRRFGGDFFVQSAFDYQWRTEPRNAGGVSTSPLGTDPIAVRFNQNHNRDVALVQDSTLWNFKGLARYVFAGDLAVSTNLRVQSGFPYARLVRIPIFAGTGVNTGGRSLGQKSFFVENIDNNRSQTVPIWDLRVDKSFNLGDGGGRFTVMLDAYNVLNSNADTNIFLTTGNFERIIATLEPRTLKIGLRWTY